MTAFPHLTRPTTVTDLAPRPPSSDDVRSMLAGVLDPELHASIVDLGMVHGIE